jgi:hypothetical protein
MLNVINVERNEFRPTHRSCKPYRQQGGVAFADARFRHCRQDFSQLFDQEWFNSPLWFPMQPDQTPHRRGDEAALERVGRMSKGGM